MYKSGKLSEFYESNFNTVPNEITERDTQKSESNFNTVPNEITMNIPLGSRFGTRLDQKNLFIFFKVCSARLEAQKSSGRVVDLILTKTQST